MKPLFLLSLLIVLLAACTQAISLPLATVTSEPSELPVSQPATTPLPNPYAPQPGDDTLARSSAFLNSADLLTMESFPVQIMLILSGDLPTPCHNLRAVVHPPDNSNNIDVEIYSVSDAKAVCVQVLQSFQANIPLGAFPSGRYTVSVNGQRVGEFNS